MAKTIITVALTGGFHGKEANPNLPEQPDEIARAALECYQAGACIAHIHARVKGSGLAIVHFIHLPLVLLPGLQ